MSSDNIQQEMCSLMFSAGRLLRERSNHLPRSPIWTFPMAYAETARYVATHEPVNMKDLAEYLHIKPPSATAIVNQMIRAKLVVRERVAADRRAVRIRISTFGRKVMKERAIMARRIMSDATGALNETEQKTLIKLLSKILDNVKK